MDKKKISSLFSNPMIENARKNMSQQDLDNYKKKGEGLYNSIDFEKNINLNPVKIEVVEYLEEAIKSGLHISYLAKNEQQILENFYGKKWYEKFGYKEKDISEISTLIL